MSIMRSRKKASASAGSLDGGSGGFHWPWSSGKTDAERARDRELDRQEREAKIRKKNASTAAYQQHGGHMFGIVIARRGGKKK